MTEPNVSFQFVCPECGGTKAVELIDCAWCASEIIDVDMATGELVYGPSEITGDVYEVKYICAACKHVLEDVESTEDFITWLKTRGTQSTK